MIAVADNGIVIQRQRDTENEPTIVKVWHPCRSLSHNVRRKQQQSQDPTWPRYKLNNEQIAKSQKIPDLRTYSTANIVHYPIVVAASMADIKGMFDHAKRL
jgi:hypothetical protein